MIGDIVVVCAGAGLLVGGLGFALYRGVLAGRPTAEDRRRTAVLAADPVFALTITGVEAEGAVSTWPGGGRGPTLRASQALRRYSSRMSLDDLRDQLEAAAVRAGWRVAAGHRASDGAYLRASRSDRGFGASLGIHVIVGRDRTEVLVRAETTAVAAAPRPPHEETPSAG